MLYKKKESFIRTLSCEQNSKSFLLVRDSAFNSNKNEYFLLKYMKYAKSKNENSFDYYYLTISVLHYVNNGLGVESQSITYRMSVSKNKAYIMTGTDNRPRNSFEDTDGVGPSFQRYHASDFNGKGLTSYCVSLLVKLISLEHPSAILQPLEISSVDSNNYERRDHLYQNILKYEYPKNYDPEKSYIIKNKTTLSNINAFTEEKFLRFAVYNEAKILQIIKDYLETKRLYEVFSHSVEKNNFKNTRGHVYYPSITTEGTIPFFIQEINNNTNLKDLLEGILINPVIALFGFIACIFCSIVIIPIKLWVFYICKLSKYKKIVSNIVTLIQSRKIVHIEYYDKESKKVVGDEKWIFKQFNYPLVKIKNASTHQDKVIKLSNIRSIN